MQGTVGRIGGGVIVALVGLALLGPPAAARSGPDDGISYVAMGDSFTSGPLVLPHDTTWVPQDCGQSIFNYPHVAARAMQVASFVDVSCGAATIDDLYEPQTATIGSVVAPQLDAVGPDTDVVTLGMGGNDVGFVGLAMGCLRFLGPPFERPCTPDHVVDGRDRVSERIARVGPELGQAIQNIRAEAPDAEIFVVGYQASLPDDAKACWPYVPILQADMPYLVAKFKEMNAMLAAQAAAHGATYVDVYTPTIGHDACQLPPVAWVNALVLIPPSLVAHPNQLGTVGVGRIVAGAILDRLAEVERQRYDDAVAEAQAKLDAEGATMSSGPAPTADPRAVTVAAAATSGATPGALTAEDLGRSPTPRSATRTAALAAPGIGLPVVVVGVTRRHART